MTEPTPTLRADYQRPGYRVPTIHLAFDLRDDATTVTARLTLERERSGDDTLHLHGDALELQRLALDGRELAGNEYRLDASGLTLFQVPEQAELTIVTRIYPARNTALEGLYKSSGMYCTQCEAEGFRRITYSLDRPDVLSVYTTRIEADAKRYPVLLANGNRVADETLPGGRRAVTWHDPFPKPSYLFALVAGDLAHIEDHFTTASGREVTLQIYSEPHNIGQCDYAMGALQRAMAWDETAYGREYDLDVFMVVAVEDFNMGAMENKGLNIFNTACVLATPDTATDAAHQRVEAVVAHEYFHNWSGNRVTCRDWFQLSLKEGFTVFRDAQFSADMHSAAVRRIEEVEFLRSVQFAEDASPMAHPIRPDSYIEINNFYTTTVYEKGAEVVRMLRTLLGPEAFRAGSDLYFERHDGQAVTTEDFVAAMEAASGRDLGQFRHWYAQAGTPEVELTQHERGDGVLEIALRQSCPATPGQPDKPAFHIPLLLGVIDAQGRELAASALTIGGDVASRPQGGTLLAELRAEHGTLTLQGAGPGAVVSPLREFSAPIRLTGTRSDQDLVRLVRDDSDGFSRWDAAQTLYANEIERFMQQPDAEPTPQLQALVGELLNQARESVADSSDSRRTLAALLAQLLTLPESSALFERWQPIEVQALCAARERLQVALASTHADALLALYQALPEQRPYRPEPADMALRSLRHAALAGVAAAQPVLGTEAVGDLLVAHFDAADNLTERRAALALLLESAAFAAQQQALLAAFYERWQHEALVVDTWLSLQAACPLPGALTRLQQLEAHPAFDAGNPNKARALYGVFTMRNQQHFHAPDGSGYRFLAERVVAIDGRNPQLASRLARPLTQWPRFAPVYQQGMQAALADIGAASVLSPDLYELVSKSRQAG